MWAASVLSQIKPTMAKGMQRAVCRKQLRVGRNYSCPNLIYFKFILLLYSFLVLSIDLVLVKGLWLGHFTKSSYDCSVRNKRWRKWEMWFLCNFKMVPLSRTESPIPHPPCLREKMLMTGGGWGQSSLANVLLPSAGGRHSVPATPCQNSPH